MKKCKYDHLMATVPGIGVEAETRTGDQVFYFYEDFPDSSGISRAMSQMYSALRNGTLVKLEFHDNHALLHA